MQRENIEFECDFGKVRGWLYMPRSASGPVATVIMAHGYSAVKEQYLDRYAEVFCKSGLAVVVFDNPNFGDSDGFPRQEVDPVLQRRTYRDAISFAQTRAGLDPARIGIWGTSFSGGNVIEVAATDKRVKCVVSQVPTISGYKSALRRTRADKVAGAGESFDADRLARFRGGPPKMMRVVEEKSGQPAAMTGDAASRFFLDSRSIAPNWRNEVTLRSGELARENEPGVHIDRISPTPLLMIVADDDEVTATDLCLKAFNAALEPKKLLIVKGHHFTPYIEHFEKTSTAACEWFVSHLSNGIDRSDKATGIII